MTTRPMTGDIKVSLATVRSGRIRHVIAYSATILGICVMLGGVGCQDQAASAPVGQAKNVPEVQTISEGDVLRIEFPGSPNLNTTQAVRRDGRISLSIVGEVLVTGMTPVDLEKDLAKRYSTQLLSSEVNVTVVSSSFTVFVTGAVLRPGKIQPDHPLTALEAVMEAGGFDNEKADTEGVIVIRQLPSGGTKNYTVNLKEVIDGKSSAPFYLKPSDIVYVKEKFSWF